MTTLSQTACSLVAAGTVGFFGFKISRTCFERRLNSPESASKRATMSVVIAAASAYGMNQVAGPAAACLTGASALLASHYILEHAEKLNAIVTPYAVATALSVLTFMCAEYAMEEQNSATCAR